MTTLALPGQNGDIEPYTLIKRPSFLPPGTPFQSRTLFAAAHVVADPEVDNGPGKAAVLDWEATLAYRHHLWSYGFGVAEAMDTAQRGMGLDWRTAQELIRRSLAEAKSVGGRVACGAGTDQLAPSADVHLDDVIAAYETQCAFVEAQGGQIILMASRALAKAAKGPDDYLKVYDRILAQAAQPVILHWLGEMFDPELAGYWGSSRWQEAMETCLTLIGQHRDKVDGIKISLLDADKEVFMRRRLPEGVRMYTGDDFNYDVLIRGDERDFSHGLLGIFDAIAPVAAAALHALDAGDVERYGALLAPTVPLARHIFEVPTYHYKTGIVFLAYLNGFQEHFKLVGGLETARSVEHLTELFRRADRAGVLLEPELAVARMSAFLQDKQDNRMSYV